MNPGELKHRVTIQERSVTRDTDGGESESWVDFATVWAAVEPLQGREFFAAQQTNSEVTGKVRLRYLAGVKPTMRVLFGARVFDILAAVCPAEDQRETVLMVRELHA